MLYLKAPFFILSILAVSRAQHNAIVNNTSPTIQYEGNTIDASICHVDADGNILGGQPGCYNVPSGCTEGASMSQDPKSAASFSFNGSAIYIESLLYDLSPIYTVTLDGQSTDIDGVRASRPFICAPLFSQTGLNPSVEHQVRLSVKGPSPNRNMSIPDSENGLVFSLISYTFTENDSNGTNSANASQPSAATPSGTETIHRHRWGGLLATLMIVSFIA